MSGNCRLVCGELTRYFGFGSPQVLSTTTNSNSNAIFKESPLSSFQGIVTGTGAVTATVDIQVTNEDETATGVKANWVAFGTITLTGTTTATGGFCTEASWRWVRAAVTNVTGTGATVEVLMGT